jgi:single-strand DNA-binding protein
MNSVQITGNLGRDAELKSLGDNVVCSFSVGDSQGKDKPAIWWNCSLWGKRGESLAQYLVKGQQVTVFGSLSEREWTDKEGQPRKSFELKVNDVALQGGKPEAKQEQRMAPKSQDGFKARQLAPKRDELDSDIPF